MITRIILIIQLLFLFAVVSGCSTIPPEEKSSMPWSQPQYWERSGFSAPGLGF